MRDEDFDEILKGKLQAKDSQTPDWLSMQDKLDQQAKLDEALDQRVIAAAAALNDDSEPDWSTFSQRQDHLRDRHKKIIAIKTTELLMLLLCFSIYGVSSSLWTDLAAAIGKPVLMADASTAILLQRAADDVVPLGTITHQLPASSAEQTANLRMLNPSYAELSTLVTHTTTDHTTTDHTTTADSEDEALDILPLPPRNPVKLPVEPPSLTYEPATVAALEILPVPAIPTGWVLGGGFSRNADFIHTPTDVVYKGLGAYSTIEQGYTVDVSIRRRLGRLELSSGLAYTRQSYDPRPFSETNIDDLGQVTTARLADISFDIVKVPLSLSYHYAHRGVVSAFVSAGLTSNWVVNTRYQVKQEKQSPNRRVVRAVDIKSGQEIGEDFQLSEKDFSPGLLSGGSLAQNLFLSATIDTGAEVRVADKTYVRLSAGYMHNLGVNIGPNRNRIHSLSMRLGVSRLL